MQTNPQRSPRQHRLSRRVNAWILTGYAIIAPAAAVLKAWETVQSRYPLGWLAKTNAVVWDTVTLAGAIGVLALGVREMVLAYFMRKEYEEDLAALLQNQQAQAEMVKAQAEAARNQYELAREQSATVQAVLADARAQREAEAARAEHEAALWREQRDQAERDALLQREQAERDATQIQELTNTVRLLLEQNRQLIERLDRRNNGHNHDNPQPEH